MSRKPKSTHSLLDGVDLRKPECKGFLFKQSKTHRAYNKRYFALYKKFLVYYETEEEFNHDVSRRTLEHRHAALILDGLYLTKPEHKPHGAKYCFVLHCPNKANNRKEMLLVSHTKDDRKMWMDKLQEQNKQLVPLPKKISSSGTASAKSTAQATPQQKATTVPQHPKSHFDDAQKPVDKAAENGSSKDEQKTVEDKPQKNGESKQESKAIEEPTPTGSTEETLTVEAQPQSEENTSTDDLQGHTEVHHMISAESDVAFSPERDIELQNLEVIAEHSDDEESQETTITF